MSRVLACNIDYSLNNGSRSPTYHTPFATYSIHPSWHTIHQYTPYPMSRRVWYTAHPYTPYPRIPYVYYTPHTPGIPSTFRDILGIPYTHLYTTHPSWHTIKWETPIHPVKGRKGSRIPYTNTPHTPVYHMYYTPNTPRISYNLRDILGMPYTHTPHTPRTPRREGCRIPYTHTPHTPVYHTPTHPIHPYTICTLHIPYTPYTIHPLGHTRRQTVAWQSWHHKDNTDYFLFMYLTLRIHCHTLVQSYHNQGNLRFKYILYNRVTAVCRWIFWEFSSTVTAYGKLSSKITDENFCASEVWCSVLRRVAACCGVLRCAVVCCRVMQCVAVCCSVLHCAAMCCNVLHYVVMCCSVWECVIMCCSVWQCAPIWCSVWQCVVMCCNVLQSAAVCCSVLQYVAICCNMLQRVTVCCNMLQCVAVCRSAF